MDATVESLSFGRLVRSLMLRIASDQPKLKSSVQEARLDARTPRKRSARPGSVLAPKVQYWVLLSPWHPSSSGCKNVVFTRPKKCPVSLSAEPWRSCERFFLFPRSSIRTGIEALITFRFSSGIEPSPTASGSKRWFNPSRRTPRLVTRRLSEPARISDPDKGVHAVGQNPLSTLV